MTSFPGVLKLLTLNDLKPPKYIALVIFFAILGCGAYFSSKLHRHYWRTGYWLFRPTIFSAQNVDFNRTFKKSSVHRHQISALIQNGLLFYCTLYTDCTRCTLWQHRCCRASCELCSNYRHSQLNKSSNLLQSLQCHILLDGRHKQWTATVTSWKR